MKAGKAPGKGFRKGIDLIEFFRKSPNDRAAEDWFIEQRWPGGDICCPRCGSLNVQTGCKHKTMPFRCRERACGRRRFSTKTGTVMEHSKLGYQVWLLANFLLLTSLKSGSSLKLHRDLGVTQRPPGSSVGPRAGPSDTY